MGQLLYESFDKQDSIMSAITALFTHIITTQTDSINYITFKLSKNHLFQIGEVIKITGVVDGDGVALDDYNQTFQIYDIPDSTTVRVEKIQSLFNFTLEYDATANFDNASLNNVRVKNDPTIEYDVREFPIVMVDVDDTTAINSAGRDFIPAETFFPISVIHRLDEFAEGELTQLRACRYFVAYKLQQILDEIQMEIASNIGRLETYSGSDPVSIIGVTVKK